MKNKTKVLYRTGNHFASFSASKAEYVGKFELREHDGITSWGFVFSGFATQDTTANQWVTNKLAEMNERLTQKAQDHAD